jgi:hypothetical protein
VPTNLELASLEAFDDLLAHAGKSLAVGGEAVQGLVQFIEPENAVYSLEKGEGQDAKVKVKISDWPSGYDRQGRTFAITSLFNFRVKNARRDTLFIEMLCEVTDA